jgi:hypothetical protein
MNRREEEERRSFKAKHKTETVQVDTFSRQYLPLVFDHIVNIDRCHFRKICHTE